MLKKIVKIFLFYVIIFNSGYVFGQCDFSKIEKRDNLYLYSKDLHICVGELQRDLQLEKERNIKLTESLSYKDQAMDLSLKRTEMWMDTSFKLEDRLSKVSSLNRDNQWVYYGLGALSMFLAVYATSKIVHP